VHTHTHTHMHTDAVSPYDGEAKHQRSYTNYFLISCGVADLPTTAPSTPAPHAARHGPGEDGGVRGGGGQEGGTDSFSSAGVCDGAACNTKLQTGKRPCRSGTEVGDPNLAAHWPIPIVHASAQANQRSGMSTNEPVQIWPLAPPLNPNLTAVHPPFQAPLPQHPGGAFDADEECAAADDNAHAFPHDATNSEILMEALERASEITPTTEQWLAPDGMKLRPAGWVRWGETPLGATGPIDWLWLLAPPPPSSHPNHASAVIHKDTLGAQLDEASSLGMIEWLQPGTPVSDFVSCVLPLGARVKPNGKVRMLVDPSLPGADGELSLNARLRQLPCSMSSIDEIFAAVKPHSVLGKRDLINGFYHLVCSERARKYMGLQHPVTGAIGRWVVLPQGTSQSPALFCEVSNAACRIFNREFKRQGLSTVVFCHVDDYCLIADTHADMQRAFALMDQISADLGLSWNPSKDVGRDSPVTRLEMLGLIIDAPTVSLHLPDNKRETYLQDLSQFRRTCSSQPTCPRKPLERLLGRLAFTCKVCRWGYLFLQACMDALYTPAAPLGVQPVSGVASHPARRASHGHGSVTLTEAVWDDLSFWEEALGPRYHQWMGVRQQLFKPARGAAICTRAFTPTFDVELFTDASKSYGVGGVLGADVLSQVWDRDVSADHIGTLELEALYRCLFHWRNDLAGSKVLAWMDNMQALVAVNKGASRIPALRPILKRIAWLGMEHHFEVRALHIKGIFNPADAPSRGARLSHDWTFVHASEFNTPPAQVDCCAAADGSNALPGCSEWFAASNPSSLDPKVLAGKVLWACVPFACANETLSAIVEAWRLDPRNTVATMVVPEWPTAAWYRRYVRRKNPLFKLVRRYPANSSPFPSQA
jgi:hypothetical protein